jgi:hypothetical protein
MKFFTGRALLAAATLSAAVVIPFLPAARKTSDRFDLEVTLTSSASGHLQLYYDRGDGYNESDSTRVAIEGGARSQPYRLNLPPGIYRSLRFDPLDRDGTFLIAAARIVDRADHDLRDIPLRQFKPLNQIQSLRETDGHLEVVSVPGGNDPQLLIAFDSPLPLASDWTVAAGEWVRRAGAVFLLLAAVLWALDRFAGLRGRAGAFGLWAVAKPNRAIAAVAAAAVIVSAYPVVFLGKSFVSPNFGAVLLYDGFPTLPGYTQDQVSDVKGSDVGAIMWEHIPFSMIEHRALLRDGELPLWNRYDSGGTPLLGQGQSMIGDPLHLLVVVADGAAWAWDLKYLIAKWLFAFGLGLLVWAIARHLPSALLVTLGAPFVGFFVYRVNHPANFSLCYAPWPLYCWLRTARASGGRAIAGWLAGLMLANLALLGSGTVKEAYMLLVSMNLAGVCCLLAEAAPWKRRIAKFGAAAWAGVLFILLTAPLWGVFLASLAGAYTNYDAVSAYQIQPGMLLGAFDEAFYRPLSRGEIVFNPSANFLILAGLLYFLATLRLHFANRTAIAIAVASLFPLSMAFGLVPPAWIVRLPFLANVAHIDNSFSCGLIVLWAVLAGVGFAAAARRLGEREGRDDLIVAASLLFALTFGFVAFCQAVHRSVFGPGITFSPLSPGQSIPISPFVWTYLASLLVATVALGCITRQFLRRRISTPVAGILLTLCVAALLWRQGQQAGEGFSDYVTHPLVRADFHAPSAAVSFVQAAQRSEPARSVGLESNLFPGWTGVYGIESISGPDALIDPYYRELTLASPLQSIWGWRLYLSRNNLATSRPFLDFLNVRYYLDEKGGPSALGSELKLDQAGDLDVYESPTAWPRAFFTNRLGRYARPEQFVQQVLQGDGRPFASTLPGAAGPIPTLASLPDDQPSRTVVPANHYKMTEDTTSFDVQAPEAGLVVLTETYWPGYSHAEVDGRKVPVVRVNHAFQGVAVNTEGLHHISFQYRPRHFYLMLELCGAGLVLTAGTLAIVKRCLSPAAERSGVAAA